MPHKQLVVIDDNPHIRLPIKAMANILARKVQGEKPRIYTSNNGVEGLGLIYATDPDEIIVDTTLPKYSGMEVVDFLSTHQRLGNYGERIMVLSYKDDPRLAQQFSVADKINPAFIPQIINKLQRWLGKPVDTSAMSQWERVMFALGEYILRRGARIERFAHEEVPGIKKIWQVVSYHTQHHYLNVLQFILLLGTYSFRDSNIQQQRADLVKFRTHYYLTFLTTITALFLSVLMVVLVILPALFLSQRASAAWYDNLWGHRSKITIAETMVPDTAVSLSNFPVLIQITDTRLRSKANGGNVSLANGHDILFTGSDETTKLSHEITSYDPATGALVAWVKIPTLSATVNTEIYMYYGRDNSLNQQNAADVWSNGYIGVYHMENDPSSSATMPDSTSNGHNATMLAGMLSNQLITSGKVGKSISFDGTGDGMNLYSSGFASAFNGNEGSFSLWVKVPSNVWAEDGTVLRTILQIGADTTNRVIIQKTNINQLNLSRSGTTAQGQNYITGAETDWVQIAFNWSDTGDSFNRYYNGTLTQNNTNVPTYTGTVAADRAMIGAHQSNGSSPFLGEIDEVRISSVPRTAEWTISQYNTQNSPGTYLTLAAESTVPAVAPTLDNVREGTFFVRSDGSDTVTLTRGNGITQWPSYTYVKRPNGSFQEELVYNSSQGSGSAPVTLNTAGDYAFILTQGYRVFDVTSTAPIVLRPNERRRTFRDLNLLSHAATKMYFYIAPGTTTFDLEGMITRGDGVTREVILYNPDGTIHTTMTPSVSETTWSTTTIASPTSGFWAASIYATGTNAEGGFWLQGVPNYFSNHPSNWFEPTLTTGTVTLDVNADSLVGNRGLIGAGRLAEAGSLSTIAKDAFLDLGLEANETPVGLNFREPTNDNGDPNVINPSGFNFTNQNVDLTVTELNAEPVIYIGHTPAWYDDLYPGACPTDPQGSYDACLQHSETHAEYAEAVIATLEHYIITQGYTIRFVKLVDEPNIDGTPAADYAALLNAVSTRIQAHANPAINTVRIYGGSYSMYDQDTKDYISSFLAAVTPNNLRGVAIHPWNHGYGGGGTIYSTRIMRENIQSTVTQMDALSGVLPGGASPNVIIPELNAKFGDSSVQDQPYLQSFDHAIWWWSAIINLQSTGRVGVVNYYPFLDDNTVHNYRGAVYSDNGMYKPIAHAIKFMMTHIQDKVVSSTIGGSMEVEALTTLSTAEDVVNIMIANKDGRSQNFDIDLTLPNSPGSGSANVIIRKIDNSDYSSPTTVSNTSAAFTANELPLNFTLNPNSLYMVTVTDFVPPAVCGNGAVEAGETCDDGNTANGDRCSSDCTDSCTEGFNWNGATCIVNAVSSSSTSSAPAPVCGNSVEESPEVCDDGNTANGDSCSDDCADECTGGQIWNGSACVAPAPSSTTSSATSSAPPAPVCGDGDTESPEVCDDGNTSNGDSCSASCDNLCTGGEIWNGDECVPVASSSSSASSSTTSEPASSSSSSATSSASSAASSSSSAAASSSSSAAASSTSSSASSSAATSGNTSVSTTAATTASDSSISATSTNSGGVTSAATTSQGPIPVTSSTSQSAVANANSSTSVLQIAFVALSVITFGGAVGTVSLLVFRPRPEDAF